LPLWLGFNATCGLAIAVSIAVAIVAFRLSNGPQLPKLELDDPIDKELEVLVEPSASLNPTGKARSGKTAKT